MKSLVESDQLPNKKKQPVRIVRCQLVKYTHKKRRGRRQKEGMLRETQDNLREKRRQRGVWVGGRVGRRGGREKADLSRRENRERGHTQLHRERRYNQLLGNPP